MKEFVIFIGGYSWTVRFEKKELMQKSDGQTFTDHFLILIRDDLSIEMQRIVFIHEVVHAILTTQGRYAQVNFNVEEMCEFIAYRQQELESLLETFDAQTKK